MLREEFLHPMEVSLRLFHLHGDDPKYWMSEFEPLVRLHGL